MSKVQAMPSAWDEALPRLSFRQIVFLVRVISNEHYRVVLAPENRELL
jgi:hypothetical protein